MIHVQVISIFHGAFMKWRKESYINYTWINHVNFQEFVFIAPVTYIYIYADAKKWNGNFSNPKINKYIYVCVYKLASLEVLPILKN